MYTVEQQAEHRALWVAALRSGEYKQTRASLQDTRGFCCLGVACDVAIKNGLPLKVRPVGNRYAYGEEENKSGLPAEMLDWLGLTEKVGKLTKSVRSIGRNNNALTDLNDILAWDFSRIADLIEGGGVCTQ